MKIKLSTNVDNFVHFVEKLLCVSRETIVLVASYVPRETFFKLTTVCYLINERSLIRFLCVGKDPRIKSEDDIYLSLRGAKRRGNLESGLPRYARSDKRNIF